MLLKCGWSLPQPGTLWTGVTCCQHLIILWLCRDSAQTALSLQLYTLARNVHI